MKEKFDFYCLGSNDCFPVSGNDSSSYLINGHILIDLSYSTVANLLNGGFDPCNVDTIIMTHWHFDHYAGLAPFLYYVYSHKNRPLNEYLKIYCPPENARDIIASAIDYVHYTGLTLVKYRAESIGVPDICLLPENGSFDLGDIKVDYIGSHHALHGRCYRFTNASGNSVGFSGDTSYFPGLEDFFSGVDTLVYENSYGTREVSPDNAPGHCSANDAARVASAVNAGKLLLVHVREGRGESAACAAGIFRGDIFTPVTGTHMQI